eukprot:CAMPEP_0180122690 /NCGR_PEP_ID=MMETSP0986-20121125/3708_1 /TAXON_ID=697907 /ORGANISM="non described non described, Strain CCMP2293" /LENGTH=33 /DNA_ID= /DNA_START= /DNA_END= /DNA_ORIENTATION=
MATVYSLPRRPCETRTEPPSGNVKSGTPVARLV